MSRAIFPGSFDPITLGHVDVVRRLAVTFKDVTVLIADSSSKKVLFTASERVELAQGALRDLPNVKIESWSGLTVEFAKAHQPAVLVRSLRGTSDFDYERSIAEANRLLNPEIDTIFLFARPEYTGIASSLVKEIAKMGGDLTRFLSPNVLSAIKKKI